jgi:hypothetical protein
MGPLRMVMTYMLFDAPWHKEQEYIQFNDGKFNSFKDIKTLIVPHPTPGDNDFNQLSLVLCLKTFT